MSPLHNPSAASPCRVAQAEDVTAMVPIYADSFPSPLSQDALAAWCADAGVVAGVCVVDDAVQGMVMARVAVDEADILTLAVAPGSRGLGYGQALMDWLLTQLAGRGVVQVWLEVRASAAPARALYKKLGFQEAGVRPAYYATAHPAQREDAMLMRLHLDRAGCA